MALYFGGEKVNINFDGVVCRLNLFTITQIVNENWLLSSDNYILTDSKGVYLTIKEDEQL